VAVYKTAAALPVPDLRPGPAADLTAQPSAIMREALSAFAADPLSPCTLVGATRAWLDVACTPPALVPEWPSSCRVDPAARGL